MPFYELKCKKCGCEYDVMCMMAEMDEEIKKAKCENCGSKSKDRVFTPIKHAFEGAAVIGTDKWCSSDYGHDYRYKYNNDRPGGIRDQRKNAEAKSHMGPEPYNKIDDISSGKHFGEVK
jgi:putative FmdB family regulatory protein